MFRCVCCVLTEHFAPEFGSCSQPPTPTPPSFARAAHVHEHAYCVFVRNMIYARVCAFDAQSNNCSIANACNEFGEHAALRTTIFHQWKNETEHNPRIMCSFLLLYKMYAINL